MRELQDQVRDLMFYLETQKKIADTPEETRQVRPQGSGGLGQLVLPSSLLSSLLLMCRGALPSLIPCIRCSMKFTQKAWAHSSQILYCKRPMRKAWE